MLDFTRNICGMTGFIFTFSLFCSAVIQADPAVLQSADAGVIRHILEAAAPTLRAQINWTVGKHHPACSTAPTQVKQRHALPEIRLLSGSSRREHTSVFLRSAHPIRAPSAAHTRQP
ncbi:MAG: hypothetical protein C0600_15425 [Ignavibacteria bacterium]|nr:MAG: hypothetical protein C0600_15425 [Ignavibacteria bacterium]